MDILAFRKKVRPIILALGFTAIGLGFAFVLKEFFHLNLSKLELSVIAFIITSLSVLWLFPKVFKIPFGKVSIVDFINKIGLKKPKRGYLFIILGIVAAFFTLSGMLLGSILTGKYSFNLSTITIAQAVFSLTPGIWEEVLCRGVIMIVLLRLTKSYKKSFIIQIILFGLVHIKGIDLLSLVDAFSVTIITIAFTYIALKTKSLIPGIIFHYLHDTFLFAVQLPSDDYIGFSDNAFFYSALWLSIAISIVVIKKIVEKFNIVSDYDFYSLGSGIEDKSFTPISQEENINKENRSKKVLIMNAIGFSVILLASLDESNLFTLISISLFILANIVLYIIWEKIKSNINFQINLITSLVSFVTAYDLFSKGSKKAYIFWILIGFIYIIVAFKRKYWKRNSSIE